MKRYVQQEHDLPAGMVTIGGALAGFLTELEERCKQQETTADQRQTAFHMERNTVEWNT